MENRKVLLVCALLVALFAPSVFAGKRVSNEDFKNLSGTAEEMSAMRLPAAETLGTRSKSAMLPIQFSRDRAGNAVFSTDLPIENAEDLKISLLAPNSRDWQLTAKTDDSEMNLRQSALVETQTSEVGFDGVDRC